jgi:hydrogenase expression/formation protein HypC
VTLECHSDHCITCADEGTPMTVLRIDEDRMLALCADDEGEKSSIEIALVDVRAGDSVLVHAGVALTRLDAGSADLGGAQPR